tara:strand:+ start:2999 stop:3499 length:501 start_codon:yes stop_codon:yes gene_type:complete
MSDKGIANIQVKFLSDLNKCTLSGSMSYTPIQGDKWLYKEIIVDEASAALLQAGIEYEGTIRADGTELVTATGDKVKWIAIKHTGTTNGTTPTSEGVVVSLAAAADGDYNEVEGIFIDSGDLWVGKLPATTLNTIGAGTVVVTNGSPSAVGTGDVLVQVAAIITDV